MLASVRAWWFCAFAALVIVNCEGSKDSLPDAGELCALNSDCQSPLKCALERCRSECKADDDCPYGAPCVVTSTGGVCRLQGDAKCFKNSDCGDPRLICAADNVCRRQCEADVDCPKPQVCVAPYKVCAAKSELSVDGKLPVHGGEGGQGGAGGVANGGSAGANEGGASAGTPGTGGVGTGGMSTTAGGVGASAGEGGTNEGGSAQGGEAGAGGGTASGGVASGGAASGGVGGSAQGGSGGASACIQPGNRALHFGGNQYVQIPDSASLHPTDFTWEGWVSFDAWTNQTIVSKPYGAAGYSFIVYYNLGTLRAAVNWTSESDTLAHAWVPAPGRFYHLAFSYEQATNRQRLYVDGSLVVSGDMRAAPLYDASPLLFGAYWNAAIVPNAVIDLDDVRLWPSARTEAQIQSDLATKLPAPLSGPAGAWAFDEGAGLVVNDASPNQNHGQLGALPAADNADPSFVASTVGFGGSYQVPAGLCGSSGACVKPDNKALHFGGETVQWGGNLLSCADSTSLRLNDFTLEAWVNLSAEKDVYAGSSSGFYPVIEKRIGAGVNNTASYIASYTLWFNSTGLFGSLSSGGTMYSLTYATLPRAGGWHRVAYSYDHVSGVHKLYLDLDLVASGVIAPGALPDYDAGPFYVGTHTADRYPTHHFLGAIDEVRVWNHARTLTQIVGDMHTCQITPATGLVSAWSFDEVGQTANDLGSNQNDLLLGATTTAEGSDPTFVPAAVPF